MITPEAYFNENDLYHLDRLTQHCEHNLVYLITCEKFPGIIMLHYREEAHFDGKWNTFNRMCRGLIVDLNNKRILAYPYNKFFNVNERPETKYEVLEKLGKFEVSEKLDGSLLILFKDPKTKQFFVTTKGSLKSDHGIYATSILPEQVKKDKLVTEYTLMFELIDKRFRIVVDYTKKGYQDGLYLIGVRHRYSNRLLSYHEVQEFANELNLHTLHTYQFNSLNEILDNVKHLPVLDEGYVIRFNDGQLVKIKGTEYLRVHRFISKLSPKYILEALGEGKEKSLIEIAPEEYRDDIIKHVKDFQWKQRTMVNKCYERFHVAPKTTRKEFALWVMEEVESELKGFLFTLFDQKPLPIDKLYRTIGKIEGVTAETKI